MPMNDDIPTCSGPSVRMTSKTWARDSHDLFDFEAQHLHVKTFVAQRAMNCIRCGTDVDAIDAHSVAPPGSECLLRLAQKEGNFWVDKTGSSCGSNKKLWLVVRDLATGGHQLAESDVIKLGRFKFRVRQMVVNENSVEKPHLKLDESDYACTVTPEQDPRIANVSCRICLLDGPGEDDPLIAPCACKGSIEYVHLGCLRHWIKGRLNLTEAAAGGSFFYRPLTCELCKGGYPMYVTLGNNKEPLVEVPKTRPPFIVLENMVRDSQQHATRGLHVISLAEKKLLRLGRGHESDVRIADVSISRCHATIRSHRGHFVLEDNNSKFGTLVALKKARALEESNPVSIQVGRTVICLNLQPNGDAGNDAATTLAGSSSGNSNRDRERMRVPASSLSLRETIDTDEP